MRNTIRSAVIGLATLVAAPALGQAPPPPGALPPPPPGSAGAPLPQPPRGPSAILDRGPGGTVHVDLHCTDAETTRACVDTAMQLFDRLNSAVQAK